MLFPTVEFALFFLLVFLASWALRRWPLANKALLVVASYVFYGWWDWRFMLLLFECTLINYVLGLALQSTEAPRRRKALLVGGVAFNLGVLGFFKYWGFFLSSLATVLETFGWARDMKIMEVVLPVGISFYTFQGLSYLVDLYRGEIQAVVNPLDMLLFKSFFPQLVAGPIVRASEFLPQLAKPADPSAIRASRAFLLIALGLFKKVVLAHYVSVEIVNPVFDQPQAFGSVDLLLAVYGYAVQIYCDFSAYSDIAIGVALLFGFEFPKNFDQPYRAHSLQDFWRRWHMTLSRFLKDYLYIPLGGNRGGRWKTYRNLFLTMVLGGLWHGAAWNFVIWGVLHGVGQCFEKFGREKGWTIPNVGAWRALRIFLVFHFVCLTWIFFNADSFATALDYLAAFTQVGTQPRLLAPFPLTVLAVGALGQFLPAGLPERLELGLGRVPLAAQAALLACAVVVLTAIGPGALAPCIYFKF